METRPRGFYKRGVKLSPKAQQMMTGKNLPMIAKNSGIGYSTIYEIANGLQTRVMRPTLTKLNNYFGENMQSDWDYIEKNELKDNSKIPNLKTVIFEMLQNNEISIEAFVKLYKLL